MPDAVIPLGLLHVMAATPGAAREAVLGPLLRGRPARDRCAQSARTSAGPRRDRPAQPAEHGLHEHHVEPGCIPRARPDRARQFVRADRAGRWRFLGDTAGPDGGPGRRLRHRGRRRACLRDVARRTGTAGARAYGRSNACITVPTGSCVSRAAASTNSASTTFRRPTAELCLNATTRTTASSRCRRSGAVRCTAPTAHIR